MGWRDRVKNNSAYSAYIAEGNQNLKNQNNNNNKGLKLNFNTYTQNTQITQNPEKDKAAPHTNSTVKDQPSIQEQHTTLWKKAWTLADEIDDVTGAPIEIRRARLPELQDLIKELTRLEKLGAIPLLTGGTVSRFLQSIERSTTL